MTPAPKRASVIFGAKGQIVIPRWLRKDFEINEGTRALVYKQNDHIVLKPLTARHYRRLRGSLKCTKAMDVFMSERKRRWRFPIPPSGGQDRGRQRRDRD